MEQVNLWNLKKWLKVIQRSGFYIVSVYNIEFLSPILSMFRYKKMRYMASADTIISDNISNCLASE